MEYVTIIKALSPQRVGKEFRLGTDGQLVKTSSGALAEGRAQAVRIGSAKEMAKLLRGITEKGNSVLMLGVVEGSEDGVRFTVVTERRLAELMGCAVDKVPGGIVDIRGKPYAARVKRGTRPSLWVLLDADNPEGMPENQRGWDIQRRAAYLEPIVPGLSACERVELCSSSSRVVKEGGNLPRRATHALIRVSDPEKIETLREHLRVEMVLQDLSFGSPRHSRENGEIIGQSARTVFDIAVFVPGRLVFVAAPLVDAEGYSLADANVQIVNEGAGALDLSSTVLPSNDRLDALREKTGADLSYSCGGGLSVKDHSSLSWDTPIEVRGSTCPLRDVVVNMKPGDKLRCETPFRASNSEAAFIRILEDGLPMLYDVGTSTTYFLPHWERFDRVTDHQRIALERAALAGGSAAALGPKPSFCDLLADQARFTRNRKLPVANVANAVTVLTESQEWDKVFAYDEMADEIMVLGPVPGARTPQKTFKPHRLRDAEIIQTQVWMQRHGFSGLAKQAVTDAIALAAYESVISPVRHYLEGLEHSINWSPATHEPLVHRLCADYFGATEDPAVPGSDPEYLDEVSRRFMVAAVARAFDPGCQVDSMLVLEGAQGRGKSSSVGILFGGDYFSDCLPQIGTKDANDHLRGKWCIEVPELSAIGRADVENVKAFISRRVERYRRAYDRTETVYPRRCVFIGTTNQDTYLRDETGNRRFWPVRVGKIDLTALRRDRDLLWAEAVYWYRQGKRWHLTEKLLSLVEAAQQSRVSVDMWQDDLSRALDGKYEVSLHQAAAIIGIDRARLTRTEQNRLTACLKALGFAPNGKFTSGELRHSVRYARPRGAS